MPAEDHAAGRTGPRWVDVELAPGAAVAVALGLVVLIGIGDRLTGPYLVFATFYLVPVALTAWFVGRSAALGIAALSALSGLVGTALDPREVTTAVNVWNETLRLLVYAFVAVVVSAERDAMREVRALATTDPLTRLPNRRAFFERVDAELHRASRGHEPLSVVYLDIDELKGRNDTYGHEAGDAMLVAFADTTRSTLRASDVAARLGGDEFCILLPATDLDGANRLLERLRGRLADAEPLPIRCSAGVVSGAVPGDLAIDAETVVRAADLLMLEAKASGKDRTVSRPSLVSS